MAGNNTNLMQDQLLRSGGQLYSTPTSPASGKMVGDNPDQAKMRGTPAQKTPVIKEALAPTPPPPPVNPALSQQAQAQANAQKQTASELGKFAGYNDILQNIAQKKYAQVLGQPVGLKPADSSVLNEYFAADKQINGKPISQYLNDYSLALANGSLTPEQKQQPLVELSKALSATGTYVDPSIINTWYSSVKDSLADTAAERVNNNVLMADFGDNDFKQLGIAGGAAQVANLLGVPVNQLQTMTLTDFQDAIASKQQQEYNQVGQLQAQLAQVPAGSDIARQIQDQIKALSGAGVATTEARFQEAVNNIRENDQIEIAGQNASVQDLLSDEAVSNAVSNYLDATPEQRANFFPPGYEKFKQWVDSNEQGLSALNSQLKNQAGQFAQAQVNAVNLPDNYNNIPKEVLAAVGVKLPKPGTATPQQLADIEARLKNTGIGSVLSAPEKYGLTEADTSMLAMAAKNNLKKVKEWDDKTLVSRFKMAQELKDPNSTLSQLSNIKDDFVGDGDVEHFKYLKNAAKYIDKLSSADKQALMNTDVVVNMIKKGTLTPQLIKQASEHIKDYSAAQEAAQAFKDLGTDQLISNYKMVSKLASFGDPGSIKLLKKYQEIDVNGDGTISPKEMNTAAKMPGITSFIKGDGVDKSSLSTFMEPIQPPPGSVYSKLLSMTTDGKVDPLEAENFWNEVKGLEIPKKQMSSIKAVMPEGYKSAKEIKTSQKQQQNDKIGLDQANSIFKAIGAKTGIGNVTQWGSAIPYDKVRDVKDNLAVEIAKWSTSKKPYAADILKRLQGLDDRLQKRIDDVRAGVGNIDEIAPIDLNNVNTDEFSGLGNLSIDTGGPSNWSGGSFGGGWGA